MADYKYIKEEFSNSNSTKVILRTIDMSFIPNDPKNTDWVAYQLWINEGNTPDDA